MNRVQSTKSNIRKAAIIIQKGGLVAFPTETVYGLGADALNPRACARIFEVKNRPEFDPLIVHIDKLDWIKKLTLGLDRKAIKLINKFWPGPLTLVLPKSDLVPDIVTSGLPTVAIRMPDHPVISELIRKSNRPIAAPSANPFGYLSPTTAEHVANQIGDKIDLILDGGPCPIGLESTIIELTGKIPLLLRPGGLPTEEIQQLIGPLKIPKKIPNKPLSPGQLLSHYSPRTPIQILIENKIDIPDDIKAGLLCFQEPVMKKSFKVIEILSSKGDLREAAANFFSSLHRLDNSGLDIIYAHPLPEIGLGRAIMDRLKKASSIKSIV